LTHRTLALASALTLALTLPAPPAEHIHSDVNARIRQEGLERSQVMQTAQVLTDLYGPRLTGSPSLEAAGRWAVGRMEEWGLTSVRMEPWTWGHPGWTNERATGALLSPVKGALTFEALAWTPGTNGVETGRAFHLVPPARPTEATLTAYLESIADNVRGAMVLVGPHRPVPVNFQPAEKRRNDEGLKRAFDPEAIPAPRGPTPPRPPAATTGGLSATEVHRRIDRFLLQQGARVRINDAARPHGQVIAYDNPSYDISTVVPTIVMRNEDYGRITRILSTGTRVDLQFEIVNRLHPEGATAYNATAELPGTDLAAEVVMIGGHLDSWHSATGATDNAIGCAIMMEAVRILKAVRAQPRRTIRVALWSGEEQGLLGSKAYVAQHFGTFEDQEPGFASLVAYLNLDGGTGRIRGASVFGPPAAAQVLRGILAPFEDIGVIGAAATASRGGGGSDHASFSAAGLSGINFMLDPIEYSSHTHHTNLDTFERLVEGDARQSAVVVASAVYHLAMRDEPLPRFSKADMPAARVR